MALNLLEHLENCQNFQSFSSSRVSKETYLRFAHHRRLNGASSLSMPPLWESVVRSMKMHLRWIVGSPKLTFEEFSTVLAQVEACLNSRPLVPLPCEGDGIEALTPGHFLIGRPLESLPDPPSSYQSMTLLKQWNICQTLARHFWQRWSTDYFASLRKFTKWHSPSRNTKVGDVVLLQEDGLIPNRWPLARIVSVHPGKDNIVRVVTVKTATGMYKRPVTKVALLLPFD